MHLSKFDVRDYAGYIIVSFMVINTLACVVIIVCAHRAGLLPVRIGLSWHHSGEFAPLYYGVVRGTFEKYGLRVDLVPLRNGDEALRRVAHNEVDFEIAHSVSLVCDGSGKLKSILALYRNSPISFISQSRKVTSNDLENDNFRLGYNWKPYCQLFDIFKSLNSKIRCKLEWSEFSVADTLLRDLPSPSQGNSKQASVATEAFDAMLIYDHLALSEPNKNSPRTSAPIKPRVTEFASSFGLTVPGEVIVCGHSLLGSKPFYSRACIAALRESYLNFDHEALEKSLRCCRRLSPNWSSDELAAQWLSTGIFDAGMPVRQTQDVWQTIVNQCRKAKLIAEAKDEVTNLEFVHRLYFESFLRLKGTDP